jgi:hypothetical protein
MKRLLMIGLGVGVLALAPAMSASATPIAHPSGLSSSETPDIISVKGGKFKMKFKKPHHYKKWKHHRHHW